MQLQSKIAKTYVMQLTNKFLIISFWNLKKTLCNKLYFIFHNITILMKFNYIYLLIPNKKTIIFNFFPNSIFDEKCHFYFHYCFSFVFVKTNHNLVIYLKNKCLTKNNNRNINIINFFIQIHWLFFRKSCIEIFTNLWITNAKCNHKNHK